MALEMSKEQREALDKVRASQGLDPYSPSPMEATMATPERITDAGPSPNNAPDNGTQPSAYQGVTPPSGTMDAGAQQLGAFLPPGTPDTGIPAAPSNAAQGAPQAQAGLIQPGSWQPVSNTTRTETRSESPEGLEAHKKGVEALNKFVDYSQQALQEKSKIDAVNAAANSQKAQADLLAQQRQDQLNNDRLAAAQKSALSAKMDYQNFREDPDHFWNSKSTANQIGSAIAIGLGALGSSITKAPNYALNIINDAIQRDMHSQETEMRKKAGLAQLAQGQVGETRALNADDNNALARRGILGWEVVKQKAAQQMVGVNNLDAQAGLQKIVMGANQAQEQIAAHYARTTVSQQTNAMVPQSVVGQKQLISDPKILERVVPFLNGIALDTTDAKELKARTGNLLELQNQLKEAEELRSGNWLGRHLSPTETSQKLTALQRRMDETLGAELHLRGVSPEKEKILKSSVGDLNSWFEGGLNTVKQYLDDSRTSLLAHAKGRGVQEIPQGYELAPYVLGKPSVGTEEETKTGRE